MGRQKSTILEDDCFRAMADPTRRTVMGMLARDELAVSKIAEQLSISQPAVSQHLAVLKRTRLVRERKQGRFRYYRADSAGLGPMVNWIARYKAFWDRKLERLAAVLDEIE
jgi:DNA-binding transcriptional ArsR family regulator